MTNLTHTLKPAKLNTTSDPTDQKCTRTRTFGLSSSCQTEFRSSQHLERQTKSEPKASFRPKGRVRQGKGIEEIRNSLRRSELLSAKSFAGSVRQLTWHIMLTTTWSFLLSGYPGNLDLLSSHILWLTEGLLYHKPCNNSYKCNMSINI
jgi:hypothetical protein